MTRITKIIIGLAPAVIAGFLPFSSLITDPGFKGYLVGSGLILFLASGAALVFLIKQEGRLVQWLRAVNIILALLGLWALALGIADRLHYRHLPWVGFMVGFMKSLVVFGIILVLVFLARRKK